MENIHKGHRTRLRQVAQMNGINKMQEHQALELLLTYVIPQKDVNPLAHLLINKFGSFSEVLDAKKHELLTVKGVGENTACFLSSFKDFFFLYKENKQEQKTAIKNTKEAVAFVSATLNDKLQEELYVLCIDGLNLVKRFEQVSKGTSNATNVNIRKITEVVISSNTHNVIVCHNHPNGLATPSLADDKLTRALFMGLALNSITLLDHIIIGTNDFYSYNVSGKIDTYQKELKNLMNNEVLMQNACQYNKTNN